MTSSPWWMGAMPHQRAEAVTSRMLAGAGEWWLFGVWGRWYRCGLDGNWHLCPPPFDPAARQAVMPAPPGAGRPPVPPSLLPTGPDLTPGPLAADGLFGVPPAPAVLARLQQTVATAAGVNPAQFPVQDPHFVPGTPSTLAVCFFTVLWCAGAPVADPDHPILGLFARYLAVAGTDPRWFLQPVLPVIVGAYTERLRAGDPMGASYVVRTVWETAEALRGEAAFRPRADALAAMAGTTLQMVPSDHGGVRFGDQAIVQEWLRRCPAELRVTLLRETAPGDHFRLACYDLAAAAAALPSAAGGPAEARRVALALLAADLDGVPGSVAAVLPWLDPEGVRTLQALGQPGHPLRGLWPVDGTLPDAVVGADPQILRSLLAAAYTTALAWCRIAGMIPPRPGLTVPAALMKAILAGPDPDPGQALSPWEIIEAARAHLAQQRMAESSPAAQPATADWPAAEPLPSDPGHSSGPGLPSGPGLSPSASQGVSPVPPTALTSDPGLSTPASVSSGSPDGPPPLDDQRTAIWGSTPPSPDPVDPVAGPACPESKVVEAYGIRFLPGPDDIERLLTELRRRGTWALSLRGQEVSSASAPAVLLVGEVSCGQRRLSRMIARALADVGVGSGEVHTLLPDDLTEIDPRDLRALLAEHSGHTVLIEGLDDLVLDEDRGAAYASALYRARVEGVSDVTIAATCAPDRLRELTDAVPELITDFRTVRLPDLSDPGLRLDLASLLAAERRLKPTPEAWEVVRRDLEMLHGRGRLINARLVEAYLDRACDHHLGQAGEPQVFQGQSTLTLSIEDFQGVAAALDP